MQTSNAISEYLSLAQKIDSQKTSRHELSLYVNSLQPINLELLDILAEYSEHVALTQPRLAWNICLIGNIASQQQKCDPFVRSVSIWYLSRAANHWAKPKTVQRMTNKARSGFSKLGELGWVVASDWQANALPWTRPDFVTSRKILENSLLILEKEKPGQFEQLCRFALAYNQILLYEFTNADENLSICENYFKSVNDRLNEARCWRNKAQLLRRQNKNKEAKYWGTLAKRVFISENSLLDLAQTWNLLGMIELADSTIIDKPLYWLMKAQKLFTELDLPLWTAYVKSTIGQTLMQDGKYRTAKKYFLAAEQQFVNQSTPSLYADNNLAYGKLLLLLGLPQQALERLLKAQNLHNSVGMNLYAAVDMMVISEAYTILGRYQEAVQLIEKAIVQLQKSNNKVRIGICELTLARIWLIIGNIEQANEHLLLAETLLRVTSQYDSTVSTLILRAKIAYETGQIIVATDILHNALALCEEQNLRTHFALIYQCLGLVYSEINDLANAKINIQQALQIYKKMEQSEGVSSCYILLGDLYQKENNKQSANNAYKQSLSISTGSYPEQEWKAYSGLAEMVTPEQALPLYKEAVCKLNHILENFWQPDLAGFYSKTPRRLFSKAISLASTLNVPEELSFFIESDKANSLNTQLDIQNFEKKETHDFEIVELLAEINRIQDQIQSSKDTNSFSKLPDQKVNLQIELLKEKKQQFNRIYTRIERKNALPVNKSNNSKLSLSNLVCSMNKNIGLGWVSINYYVLDNWITAVLISPDESKIIKIPISERFKKALHVCEISHQNHFLPSIKDLQIIGASLFPPTILEQLSPNTILFIVPHQSLHGIPWPALGDTPLVMKCVPIIIPSLQTLMLLFDDYQANSQRYFEKGLFVGISDFSKRHQNLPNVHDESEMIKSIFMNSVDLQINNTPDFNRLQSQVHPNGSNDVFSWIHFATHVFSDQETGRLSSIALQNEDIWTDQIRDLAPLPRLITFSGCNSIYGQKFVGDEGINLVNACFLGGSKNVIGSIWPIADNTSTGFMQKLYYQLLLGKAPAVALCLAQRDEFINQHETRAWAGYCCLGTGH